MRRRTQSQHDLYQSNRWLRLEHAQHQCEARWHPSCPAVTADPAWQQRPHLITHHVRQRRHGGDDSFPNLRIVCEWCHNRIHSRPAEAEERGLLAAKREGGIK